MSERRNFAEAAIERKGAEGKWKAARWKAAKWKEGGRKNEDGINGDEYDMSMTYKRGAHTCTHTWKATYAKRRSEFTADGAVLWNEQKRNKSVRNEHVDMSTIAALWLVVGFGGSFLRQFWSSVFQFSFRVQF